ncbi:MAG TPA: DNA-binding protein [Geminicoccus sp.]|nr:DNA-binding protein [Geminicoccus sp.]
MADRPVYLTPQALSERLEGVISVKTLETWRWKRKGPAFVKAGGAVLYRLSDVEA